MARFARLWAPLIAYQALLFILSSRPGVPLGSSVWDKALHFSAYALLALLWARVLPGGARSPSPAGAMAAVALAALFGLADEFHQSFVPGRDASGADLIADALGAAFALLVLRWTRSPSDAARRTARQPGIRDDPKRHVAP